MGTPTATMRCPACGASLQAVLAPTPATQWFPCPRCHQPVPFVPPRELPPLYSWEVVPGLYPAQRVPRRPRWAWRRVTGVALAAAAVLAAVAAGYLGWAGVEAAEPTSYVVSGTVYATHPGSAPTALHDALVVLFTDDNHTAYSELTNTTGGFSFAGIPNGGIQLNVTHGGYGPTDVYTFASRAYSGGWRHLSVYLAPGGPSNVSSQVLTLYPDLESFLAYAGGGAFLLGVVAIAAGVGAWAVRRRGGGVAGVIGGGASISAPIVVLLFSLGAAFSIVAALAGLVGGLGAFALVLAAAEVASAPARAEPA